MQTSLTQKNETQHGLIYIHVMSLQLCYVQCGKKKRKERTVKGENGERKEGIFPKANTTQSNLHKYLSHDFLFMASKFLIKY